MTNDRFILWFLFCFLILIIIINVYPEEHKQKSQISTNDLSELAINFSLNHNRMDLSLEEEEEENSIFPTCITGNEKDCGWPLDLDIHDKKTGNLLLSRKLKRKRIYPNSVRIPKTCGFGRLVFDTETLQWECQCLASEYFGGDFCDIPGPELTVKRKCRQVAEFDNVENYDLSTFNPITNGICVECTDPYTMIPIVDDAIPSCEKEEKEEEEETKHPCFFDALNPEAQRGSPLNKFVENYGCSCDYQNGYIEVVEKNRSIACVKLGKSTNEFHRADIAFYCVQNHRKPIQVHSYKELEFPFTKIFENYRELLVLQEARAIVHNQDWLNRNVKPTKRQKIRRLNYPIDTWPVVDKHRLVNKYRRRHETNNLSTWDLSLGRGFETKHWYELTNQRWLSNTIWGTPIVFAFNAKDEIWNQKSTLNPLGVKHNWYYGITIFTQPGHVVRLDTRGYKQEKKYVRVFTHPPHQVNDMMNPDAIIYIPFLYTDYKI